MKTHGPCYLCSLLPPIPCFETQVTYEQEMPLCQLLTSPPEQPIYKQVWVWTTPHITILTTHPFSGGLAHFLSQRLDLQVIQSLPQPPNSTLIVEKQTQTRHQQMKTWCSRKIWQSRTTLHFPNHQAFLSSTPDNLSNRLVSSTRVPLLHT